MPSFAMTAAMRSFLGTFGLPLLIAILIGLAVVTIDQRGYHRAKEQERVHELERAAITQAVVAAIDKDLDARFAKISADVAGKTQTIDTEGRTIVQPIITRELLRDPGIARDRCLTPGLLNAVNAARGFLDERLAGGADNARSGNPASVPGAGSRH